MHHRLLILMAFAVSGCVGKAAVEPAAETADEVPATVEAIAAPPPPPDPLAPACIALLERLDAIQPLLAGVDVSLASQADRFDEAIAGLSRPAPEPSTLVCPPSVNASLGGKEIIGAIEWLFMEPPGRHFRARVDSGSETSSLSASDLVQFERDGDDWVRFTFSHDSADDTVEFELPVKRTVVIRQASSDDTERRLVVANSCRRPSSRSRTGAT